MGQADEGRLRDAARTIYDTVYPSEEWTPVPFEDAERLATCLFEAAAWHRTVKVVCRCRHIGLFQPHGLWWRFERRGWSGDFRDARQHFYCRPCREAHGQKVRPIIIATTKEPPTIQLRLPDERVWRQAINRFRG